MDIEQNSQLPSIDELESDKARARGALPQLTERGEIYTDGDTPTTLISKLIQGKYGGNYANMTGFLNNFHLRIVDPMFRATNPTEEEKQFFQYLDSIVAQSEQTYLSEEEKKIFKENLKTKMPYGKKLSWNELLVLFDAYIEMRKKGYPHYQQGGLSLTA